MTFPEPVISVAIEPKTKVDQDKMGEALRRLADEDPTFRVHTDTRDGPDHHLRDGRAPPGDPGGPHAPRVQGRRQRRPSAGGLPRDDPQGVEKVEGKFVRQTGGSGQYGHVVINMEPAEPGQGFVFEDKIVGGVIPREFIKPSEQGLREAMDTGVLAGYPMVDVKVQLVFGSYHDVDSFGDRVQDRRVDGLQGGRPPR
jgi:elongation factor G